MALPSECLCVLIAALLVVGGQSSHHAQSFRHSRRDHVAHRILVRCEDSIFIQPLEVKRPKDDFAVGHGVLGPHHGLNIDLCVCSRFFA